MPWQSQEGSGVEILLKKLVWPALAAEANFRNICLLSTSRTCVESRSKVGPMRTEKWYFCLAQVQYGKVQYGKAIHHCKNHASWLDLPCRPGAIVQLA